MIDFSELRSRERVRGLDHVWAILCIVIALVACNNATDHTRRSGSGSDGSAHWALNIAQPLISSFSQDAQLYVVTGAVVQTDGRLFADAGSWSFMTWSATLQKTHTVTVNHDASTTTKTKDAPTAPGRGQPIPTGWMNSQAIFQVAKPHVNAAPRQVTMTLLNWDDYPEAPGQAVWGLVYSSPGGTHKVTWDGTYLE